MAFYDFRARDLRPIIYTLSFQDVVYDNTYNTYVPNRIYDAAYLADHAFEASVTLHEVNTTYPFGNYEPFLNLKATMPSNEIVVSYNEVHKVRIVASAEWTKPGDQALSVWSTSAILNLRQPGEHHVNLMMIQSSIGRDPLMSTVRFDAVLDPTLNMASRVDLSMEFLRVDVGAKALPGSWRFSHKINLDEALVVDLPRGQWFYAVRSLER